MKSEILSWPWTVWKSQVVQSRSRQQASLTNNSEMEVVSCFACTSWKPWAHSVTTDSGETSDLGLSDGDFPVSGNGEALRSVEPGTMVFEGGKSSVSVVDIFKDYVTICSNVALAWDNLDSIMEPISGTLITYDVLLKKQPNSHPISKHLAEISRAGRGCKR